MGKLATKVTQIKHHINEKTNLNAEYYARKGENPLYEIGPEFNDSETRAFWKYREHEDALLGIQNLLTVRDKELKAQRAAKAAMTAGLAGGVILCADFIWTIIFGWIRTFFNVVHFPFRTVTAFVDGWVVTPILQSAYLGPLTHVTSPIIWIIGTLMFFTAL